MNYIKNGFNILFWNTEYYLKNAVGNIITTIQSQLRVLLRFDKIRKYIMNEENLAQIQKILFYLDEITPYTKPSLMLFFICACIYCFCWIYIIANFIFMLFSPYHFIYVFCIQNIAFPLCFFFYYGSVEFFNVNYMGENLILFFMSVAMVFLSILIPKKYFLCLILDIILIIVNIFLLINLNFLN